MILKKLLRWISLGRYDSRLVNDVSRELKFADREIMIKDLAVIDLRYRVAAQRAKRLYLAQWLQRHADTK
jgi:hypothetical protein